MDVVTLLSPDQILLHQDVSSTKRAFEELANCLARYQPELTAQIIFDAFVSREKLGSTALGNGIVLPHARIEHARPCAALLHCQEGLKMATPDKKPVYVFLALLVPDQDSFCATYSQLIAELSLLFIHNNVCQMIDSCSSTTEVIHYLRSLSTQSLAA